MNCKVFNMVVGTILIAVFLAVSSNVSASDVPDPNALIGRWEGSSKGLDNKWSSYYAIEVFHVDTKGKRVMYRYICPDCRMAGMFYEIAKLKDDKDKIAFETTWRNPLELVLKGNYLSGFQSVTGDTRIFRYDYTLKRLADKKQVFDAKELIGEWIWVSGNDWWLLTVTEVDSQSKTFKGKYKIGRDKTEYDFSDAKVIVEGDKLKVDFKTINDTLHYQLTFYPNFGEYPPVLWGKLERLDGNVFYPMFRKKEKKD